MGHGVTDDYVSRVAPPLTPQYHARIFPPFPGPNGGTFLSVADLRALKKVDPCRVSNRCIGILIQYANGQSAVLGQFEGLKKRLHSKVLQEMDQQPEALARNQKTDTPKAEQRQESVETSCRTDECRGIPLFSHP